jgi:hypothetical protein
MPFYEDVCILCNGKIQQNSDVIVISAAKTSINRTVTRYNRLINIIYFGRTVRQPRGFIHEHCWEKLIKPEPLPEEIIKVKKDEIRRIKIRKE